MQTTIAGLHRPACRPRCAVMTSVDSYDKPVFTSHEKIDEKRSADKSRNHTDWNFLRSHHRARKAICHHQQNTAPESRSRQEQAVIRPAEDSHEMRDHHADKPDHAADGYHRAGQ